MFVKYHLISRSVSGMFMIIFEKIFPGTNNAAEGYNYRMSAIFPPHPHIVRRLKDEHEFQHHKSEEAQVQVKK